MKRPQKPAITENANESAVHVHFMIPPRVALQVEQAAFACRTTKRALWIAAMREFLGKAWKPGQAMLESATGAETRATRRKRA